MAMIAHPQPDEDRPRRKGFENISFTRAVSAEGVPVSLSYLGATGVPPPSSFDFILAEFTTRWDEGECPRAEDVLAKLPDIHADDAVVLIYREFCLAELTGRAPSPREYVERFPLHAKTLERLFGLQDVLGSAELKLWTEPDSSDSSLPETGDSIGPFNLIRELGRGAFARVFLAEQTDLDDSLIVLKLSTKVTTEPSLLARASHTNIVPLLWHKFVQDGSMQLIAMPFLGGATLSAVLNHRRRKGKRPSYGRDLLAELDAVSAEEFTKSRLGSAPREAIENLSYPRAVAWLIARLAEALDHAFSRGVLHGDVKPSNILLTSDATPMLLDFNLSVGWRPQTFGSSATEPLPEAGGTLPYMAPELLLSVADPTAPTGRGKPEDRHQYDIYSLGVVLLEMLSGRSPDISAEKARSIPELASVYVSSRSQGGDALIREAHRPVPASLKAILKRCLAPDPADRYRRASQLAEDLDKWRRDEPLTYAREPKRGQKLFRTIRRHKILVAAAMIGIVVAIGTTIVVKKIAYDNDRIVAKRQYSQIVENDGAFRDRRTGSGLVKANGDPVVIAKKHLEHYEVIGKPNWREQNEYLALDATERSELEAWLLEQSLRYAHELGERSVAGRNRSLSFLEGVIPFAPYGPLLAERRSLRLKLGGSAYPPSQIEFTSDASGEIWIEEYLQGVAAELANHLDEAGSHYGKVLKMRPESFWGHYRMAAVAFALAQRCRTANDPPIAYPYGIAASIVALRVLDYGLAYAYQQDAAESLQFCVKNRPGSAALHNKYAGTLWGLGNLAEKMGGGSKSSSHFHEASEQYRLAEMLDPEYAETYLSRAFLDIDLGQIDKYTEDIKQYESLVLSRHSSSEQGDSTPREPSRILPQDPDIANAHLGLAHKLYEKHYTKEALDELTRLIISDSSNLEALYFRGVIHLKEKNPKADEDFKTIRYHPSYGACIKNPDKRRIALFANDRTVCYLSQKGQLEEALRLAEYGLKYADQYKEEKRKFHACMALAQVYSNYLKKGKVEPYLELARNNLTKAHDLAPSIKEFENEYELLIPDEVRKQVGKPPYESSTVSSASEGASQAKK